MSQVLGILGTLMDLALVIAGFTFIIFIHELGHYLAARWAGIRVLAFAIGFGAPIITWRKGLGFRRGSSEAEYLARARTGDAAALSPTEYRFNVLPLGGYVKMLGQDDLDPAATSSEPDSYQACTPSKRMVVISAGVVMNVILAAALYVIVFMVGLRTEPARVGFVIPGSPAATASPVGHDAPTVVGLRPGDTVVAVNDRPARTFNDLVLAGAMARRGQAVRLDVRREGEGELRFEIIPKVSDATRLLDLGILPLLAPTIETPSNDADAQRLARELARVPGLTPGLRLIRIDHDDDVLGAHELDLAAKRGAPFEAEFESPDGVRITAMLTPIPLLDTTVVTLPGGGKAYQDHLLGLTPVLRVGDPEKRAVAMGLRTGDVFARLGDLEFPSVSEGIAEIRRHRGSEIQAVVLRESPEGIREIPLALSVTRRNPRIGFVPEDTAALSTLLSLPPSRVAALDDQGEPRTPPAFGVIARPGLQVLRVAGQPVSNLVEAREAFLNATRQAHALGEGASIDLDLAPFGSSAAPERLSLDLTADDLAGLHALGWRSPISIAVFETEQINLVASGPIDAIRMGLAETHRVMLLTYATFARLFEGTVRIEHLKGPVGIAHFGTRIASKGPVWLLFFMALISINLAVINFLPLPIVDGGQFVFLLVEQARGKPVPVGVQNAATLVGIILIGSLFLLVTYQDLAALFAG